MKSNTIHINSQVKSLYQPYSSDGYREKKAKDKTPRKTPRTKDAEDKRKVVEKDKKDFRHKLAHKQEIRDWLTEDKKSEYRIQK